MLIHILIKHTRAQPEGALKVREAVTFHLILHKCINRTAVKSQEWVVGCSLFFLLYIARILTKIEAVLIYTNITWYNLVCFFFPTEMLRIRQENKGLKLKGLCYQRLAFTSFTVIHKEKHTHTGWTYTQKCSMENVFENISDTTSSFLNFCMFQKHQIPNISFHIAT